MLRIDSPGGSMLASEIIRREIDALRKAGKPVIASMSSLAASGGYYIAMDADEIWASPATLTGSIGVFAVYPTFEHTLEKIGVTSDGVGTTPLAGALSIERTLKEEPREILQLAVEHAYSTFIGHVAAAREKPFEEIDGVAQGRVWAGNDASTYRPRRQARFVSRRARTLRQNAPDSTRKLQGRVHRTATGLASGTGDADAGARRTYHCVTDTEE